MTLGFAATIVNVQKRVRIDLNGVADLTRSVQAPAVQYGVVGGSGTISLGGAD